MMTLSANRAETSQQWLDRRPFERKLSAIRSRGWAEHHLEVDERRAEHGPLPHGTAPLAEDGTLLRNGPWYVYGAETQCRSNETYDFEPAIAAHRRALADEALVGRAIGRSGAGRPRPGKPSTAASPARHTDEATSGPAKSRGAGDENAPFVTDRPSGSLGISVRPRRQMVLPTSSDSGKRTAATPARHRRANLLDNG